MRVCTYVAINQWVGWQVCVLIIIIIIIIWEIAINF